MKAIALYFLFTVSASAAIFASDDRVQASGALAHSTALQVPLNSVSSGSSGLNFDFSPLNSQSNYEFCSDEPFASEKVSPIACTGFLVAPDLLVTAGHCAVNWTRVENTVTPQCEAFGWLFDYQVKSGEQPATTGVSADKFFHCKSVVYANFPMKKNNATGKVIYGEDIALIRLDRPTSGRKIFELATVTPAIGEKLSMIGYPLGLPAKAASGKVLNYGKEFFRTDLDVNGGFSGSPVLNSQGKVAGVLVRSFPDADFKLDEVAGCQRWNHCEENGKCQTGEDPLYARGSEVQYIQALFPHLNK